MSAYRCSVCGIHYPHSPKFQKCPIHETPNAYFYNQDPDVDWEWKATLLKQRLERGTSGAQRPLVVDVPIRRDELGGYWISSHDLIQAGVQERLQTFEVLEIPVPKDQPVLPDHPCECLWEVMGYRPSTREYWVHPLRVPDAPPW